MNEIERGEQIVKALYKAAIQALIGIGVKTPDYIDKFTLLLGENLDREFLKMGLLKQEVVNGDAEVVNTVDNKIDKPIVKSIKDDVKTLNLKPLTMWHLTKAGIVTIEQLMTRMQQDSLIEIKGIKEKAAEEIVKSIAVWNKR